MTRANSDETLTRIGALLRQAEGTDNEHEADAFLQAAQRLATAASIDLAVARAHAAGKEARTAPIHRAVSIGEPGTRGLRTYVELFLAISHANDVRCDIARNSSTVYCYGFESDVAACEALYASLAVQMVRGSDGYIKSGAYRSELVNRYVTVRDEWGRTRRRRTEGPVHATTARINFQQAFARRVGARLQDACAAARAQAIGDDQAARTAGVRTDVPRSGAGPSTELVLRNKEIEIRDFHRQHSRARGTWQGYRAQAGYSSHARRAGDRAGRQARLGDSTAIGGARRAIGGGGVAL